MPVHAIEQAHFASAFTEHAADGKQADRFHPEIIGSEVIDPGIDEKNFGSAFRQAGSRER